jgi:hypothetical protein
MRDKYQIIEEPCEVKVSCTVLKTSGVGDNLVEFNDIAVTSLGDKWDGKQTTETRDKFARVRASLQQKASKGTHFYSPQGKADFETAVGA